MKNDTLKMKFNSNNEIRKMNLELKFGYKQVCIYFENTFLKGQKKTQRNTLIFTMKLVYSFHDECPATHMLCAPRKHPSQHFTRAFFNT